MANNPAAQLEPGAVPGPSPLPAGKVIVLYDGQCGFCRGWISRLNRLDRKARTVPIPVSEQALAAIEPRVRLDDCLRQLHVVTPDHKVFGGWDAVTHLLRLHPLTWLVGAVGALPLFRNLGRLLYRYVAAHRHDLSRCGITDK